MLQWASIIVAPVVFLTNLSLIYALVPVACQTQHAWPLHVSNAISLAFAILASLLAWRAMRKTDEHQLRTFTELENQRPTAHQEWPEQRSIVERLR